MWTIYVSPASLLGVSWSQYVGAPLSAHLRLSHPLLGSRSGVKKNRILFFFLLYFLIFLVCVCVTRMVSYGHDFLGRYVDVEDTWIHILESTMRDYKLSSPGPKP